MDPDYMDPEVLKARAREKGHRAEDVTVGRRPRVRPQTVGKIEETPGLGISAGREATTAVRYVRVTASGIPTGRSTAPRVRITR